MPINYYDEARDLSELLAVAGYRTEARQILAAVEDGSTFTETSMALQWALSSILSSGTIQDDELSRRISVLRAELARLLSE